MARHKSKTAEAQELFGIIVGTAIGATMLFLLIKYVFGTRRYRRVQPQFNGVFPNDVAHNLAQVRPQLFHNDSASTIVSTGSL